MTKLELINEIKSIRIDFIENKLTFDEALKGLYTLEKHTKYSFTNLYNAFYSTKPSIYIK